MRDPAEPTPAQHAERAAIALRAYGDDTYEAVVDLLTDLRHLCQRTGVDFDDRVAASLMHYRAEALP